MLFLELTPLQIAGNVIALFGMALFFISALLKTTKKILFTQSISHIINIISEICAGQYSATIGEATNIVRNGFILKNKNTRLVSIILIVLSTIIGVLVNVFSPHQATQLLTEEAMFIVGFIPVVTSLVFSCVVLIPNIKVEYTKGAMIFSTCCFSIYSMLSGNYVMGVGNIIISITTLISLITLIVKNKKEASVEK